MADYWGATADPNYGYSPYSGQLHYTQHEYSTQSFTPAADREGNSLTIEEIEMRINNAHPERIAALADQWQNAWTLMSNVRSYVLQQSNVLYNEHWKSPEARNAFMQKGPGEALAYLDVWMEAANKNITALRHLVHITQDARDDMFQLMKDYRAALEEAKNVDLGGQLSEWFDTSRYLTTRWDEADDYQVEEQVNHVKEDFTRRARELAHTVGDQYFDYTGQLSAGMGPPFRPMNAVLNAPGAPPRPNLPGGLPSVAPSAVPPPPAPVNALNAPAPAPPPAVAPPPPGVAPPVPVPNQPPGLGNPPPVAPAPPLGVAPPPLPAPPPGIGNRFSTQPPGGLPSRVRPPGAAPGSLPAPAPKAPANPGQLTKNAFNKNPGSLPPGASQPPGRTLRRPDGTGRAPGQPGRGLPGQPGQPGTSKPGQNAPSPPGRGQRGAAEHGERQPGAPVGGDEAFARPPASTTPPVLKNPTNDQKRTRPGSREELRPAAYAGDGDGSRRDGTTPPVLNSPARPAPAAPSPGQRRTDAARTRRKQAAEHGSEWIGAQEARADAGASVLDAPAPPPSGSRVSRLEEVPKELRSRAATKESATGRAARPGAVSPELSKRRTDNQPTAAQADEEARGIVTDEQAFEVQTPGGGVVTSKRDEPGYEPEQRRALGGRD